jgi:predicted nucleic-acid-binding Zn-ribbon protein
MSDAALACPKCGSGSVRRSRRANTSEMTKMMMGVYPFRCNACAERFWASVWLFDVWKWAKCPRCLNLNLTDWPKRHYHMNLWTQILTALGAHKHRCSRCRNKFVSFRPRLPEFQGEVADVDDLELNEERSVPENTSQT